MNNRKLTQRRVVCLIMILIAGVSGSVNAQAWNRRHSALETGDDYHFIYLSGNVGYSMLQTSIIGAMPLGDVGGGVGLGYEFRNSGFWANVGAQVSFHRSSLTIDEYERSFPGLDTQGKSVELIYKVNQVDQLQWNFVDVPVLVGYYVRGFHIGLGAKVSYALNPMTYSTGVYNVSGKYEMYPTPFVNMPDRGYKDYEFENQKHNELNVGASLIGEIGYDLLSSLPSRSRICHVLKLSFYFEYGLNNLLRKTDIPDSSIEPIRTERLTPIDQVTISPYMNTFANPARTVPFFAGAKITYMIGGSRTARVGFHHGCMCYN